MTSPLPVLPSDYPAFLEDLKNRVRAAQLRAVLSANREMVLFYWGIGRDILARQEQAGWGAKVIDQIAKDLSHEFPSIRGFSSRNLKYMRAFAKAWPQEAIVQQLAAQLPWFHNCVLLEKLKNPEERLAYAAAAVEHGWSRGILAIQIESGYLKRLGAAVHNFAHTLPPPQSDLAAQTLKDPYLFDFVELTGDVSERRLAALPGWDLTSATLTMGVLLRLVTTWVPDCKRCASSEGTTKHRWAETLA